MTVKELIEQLQTLPKDLEIFADGNRPIRVSHRKPRFAGSNFEYVLIATKDYYERKRERPWDREPQDEEEYDYGEDDYDE